MAKTTMSELELMTAAVEAAAGRIRAAAVAQRAVDAQSSATRQKLAAVAWRAPLLRLAGHGQDEVERLKARMESQPHLFEATGGFLHEVAMMIGTAWWAPGSSAPRTPMTDRDRAEVELARDGFNLWTAIVVAVDHAEATRPREAFGPIKDQAEYDRARQVVVDNAAARLAEVAEIPPAWLLGWAVLCEVDIEPRESLPARLVADAMNGSPGRAERQEGIIGATLLTGARA